MSDKGGGVFCVFAVGGYGFMINELVHDGRPWPIVVLFCGLALWTALVAAAWIIDPSPLGDRNGPDEAGKSK